MDMKPLVLNPAAYCRQEDVTDEGDQRHVVDAQDGPYFVELTRLPFDAELASAKVPAADKGGSGNGCVELNPWASAPPSLIRAAAKHLFV